MLVAWHAEPEELLQQPQPLGPPDPLDKKEVLWNQAVGIRTPVGMMGP